MSDLSAQKLALPPELVQDDNRPAELDLPPGLQQFPVSSAPYYTLYRLLRHLKPRSVLEIGTQHGASALAMALALRDNGSQPDIVCVDPFCPTGDNDGISTLTIWYQHIYGSNLQAGIHLLMTGSADILPFLNKQFDFVFIDGSHRYEDVRIDCLLALSLLRTGGFFLAHDYIFYESVRRACDEVLQKHQLPFAVNDIQRNHRNELCGWVIARKTHETKDARKTALRHKKNLVPGALHKGKQVSRRVVRKTLMTLHRVRK